MPAYDDERKARLDREMDRLRGEMVEIARTIHANPETGYQEHNASKLLAGFLQRHGFEVVLGVAGMETAFAASHAGLPGGPRIALLAEYDALPGMGHGCGHNLIGTAAAGAAVCVSGLLEDRKGEIVVIGCPAEEACVDGAGGKVRLTEAGCFQGVDAAFIFHPMPLTAVGGETTALIVLEFEFQGRAAHAAGNPWDGINALEGVLQTFSAINGLRQHLKDGVRIHGIVTHGGDAPNIVPEYAAARFFVRSEDTDYLKATVAKIENCARGAALATGTELRVNRVNNLYEAMNTNSVLAGVLRRNLEYVGLKVEGKKKGKGSTDFGNVTRVVPGCELSVRLGDGIVPHTREFRDAADSEEGYEVMMRGAKIMALSALDLFEHPELLEQAWKELNQSRV